MPKRKYSEKKAGRLRNKIRKYEERLRRRYESSSEDEQIMRDESPPPSPRSPQSPARSIASVVCAVPEPEIREEMSPAQPGPAATEPGATASVPDTESGNVPTADPELLLALGDFEAESDEWGPDVCQDLAKRWEPILKDGLKKELKEDLLKKCLVPKNCPLIKAPVLNPEIRGMLTDSARSRDTRIFKKQNQLAGALTLLSTTISDMLTKPINPPAITKAISDASKLIADSHYLETETRRSLITPMLDKTFIDPFKNRKRDNLLFGDNLSEFIKTSRSIQKTGKLLQSSSLSSDLNSKPSLPRSSYRGGHQPIRGRGAKTMQVYHRRQTTFQPQTAQRHRASTPRPSMAQRHKQSRSAKQKQ